MPPGLIELPIMEDGRAAAAAAARPAAPSRRRRCPEPSLPINHAAANSSSSMACAHRLHLQALQPSHVHTELTSSGMPRSNTRVNDPLPDPPTHPAPTTAAWQ